MHRTVYQWADIGGLSVFYREAGSPDEPTILLLHGFPSSSRQWEPLLARLADGFHLVAPDYPGFGHSDAPDPAGFPYTFSAWEQSDLFSEDAGRVPTAALARYGSSTNGGIRWPSSHRQHRTFLWATS